MPGTFARIKSWISAEILTASDLNAEFDNLISNATPDGLDDASVNTTAMQAVADPYPGAVASLATDLRGELQRLRYVIKQISGEAQWYIDPDTNLAGINTVIGTIITTATAITSTAAEINELHSQGAVAADFAKLHALTSTATEINELHSQGAVAADFAKLHAITITAAQINGIAPAGTIIMWATETAPSGYLECNGASLDRTTYATLFAIIGVTFGNVDGSHFDLPDLRGRFPRGWDHAAAVDPDAATRTDRGDTTGGDHVGTLQADAFESHTHTATTWELPSVTASMGYGGTGATAAGQAVMDATGGNETRPVNMNVMFCIKY